jgi:nicotinate (nicotinamide) nucleotide adenylyltransferase
MVEFFRRAPGHPGRLGILPGTFNPPTTAHLALAQTALAEVDEVLFVLPRVFPHKVYEGAGFNERVRMLEGALAREPRFSIGATAQGLFIDIAHDCRAAYGETAGLVFLCGRDAAQRIMNWDYGRPGAVRDMLGIFELLVVARQGAYEPPPDLRARIRALPLEAACDGVSATEVRRRVARGEPWEHLVPGVIVPMVREIYSR